jgi:hypothetical protein
MRGTIDYRTLGDVLAVLMTGVGLLGLVAPVQAQCVPGASYRLEPPNLLPVPVLSQLDIDGDGLPDGAVDTDGDGLPDNWEVGGTESVSASTGTRPDRLVHFSAPTAIGPGTPPTFVSARLTVNTSANSADTDCDGLTDFVEVFGLKFIDDDGDGILDPDEWEDLNGDGLPSIGEFPKENISPGPPLFRDHDFDGFMFTDPTLTDTDGDGIPDGQDPDPLINPETFGVQLAEGFDRLGADPSDNDLDNDGLGNGSDFGNDQIGAVDFPTDIGELMRLFRPDRENTIPESLIEDLIGADWNGDGLFRITDMRAFRRNPTRACLQTEFPGESFANLFLVEGRELFGTIPGAGTACEPPLGDGPDTPTTYGGRGSERHHGMGFQSLLVPAERSLPLFPDVRIWTILYAWRVPGFDVDGNGYTGSPESRFDLDDRHLFDVTGLGSIPQLDGRVEVGPIGCGNMGVAGAAGMLFAFVVAIVGRPFRRRR